MNEERQVCEVWSRVNGYLRPTSNYNDAKKAEFADRKTFKLYYETEESHI